MDIQSIKTRYFASVMNPVEKQLDSYREDFTFCVKPRVLADYPRYIRSLGLIQKEIKQLDVCFSTDSITKAFDKEMNQQLLTFDEKRVAIDEKYESLIRAKAEELRREAAEHNRKIKEDFHQSNVIYEQLEEKRLQLEKYSNRIVDLCSEYGITTSDITVDNSTFRIEELSDIYDGYLKYMKQEDTHKNPITKLREYTQDTITQVLVLLGVGFAVFTPLWSICAIALIVLILRTQLGAEKKMQYYAILLGLLYNVRPLELGFVADIDSSLLLSEEINEEEDERFDELVNEWQNAVAQAEKVDPEEIVREQRLAFANEVKAFNEEAQELRRSFLAKRDAVVDEISALIKRVTEIFESERLKVKRLGDEVNKSYVFNTVFKLGIREGVLEEEVDVGLRNMILYPSTDENLFKRFLQVLFANALCACRAGNLSVTVYDPNKFGQDLISFYNSELETLFKFENDSMSKTVDNLKKFAEKNLKEMKGMTVNQFNQEAEKVGRTPKEYKLFVVLSQPKSIEEDEALREFMSYSANLGVLIWLVSNKELPGTMVWKKPFDGIAHPYVIDEFHFGSHVADTLVRALKESQSDALLWKDFAQSVIPEDRVWSGVTDQYVELYPGYFEGDPTQPIPYTVGNEGNVHLIGVGGTGAGKSVFINHLIATLTREYSPRDLELWLVDYKGSEFAAYLSSPEHPKVLPHIKACLCTSDGDYSGSLYQALRKEAERRYSMLMDAGFKNIKDFNKHIRRGDLYTEIVDGKEVFYNQAALKAAGIPFSTVGKKQLTLDDIIPRILFINDEFQVIFQKAESKIVEGIQSDITYVSKVARAAGVHLAFFSQSMKGTIQDDILQQFTLRFALRCDQEVSMAILGTKYASEIKQKNGFLYVRSMEDKSLEAQRRFRTPFASDDVLREHINSMADLAEERGYRKKDMVSYLEKTKHYVDEIESRFRQIKLKSTKGLFLLGERMTYSSNKAPDNVILGADANTHIFAAFSETVDLVNFYKSIYKNLSLQSEKPNVMTNSQSKDLYYLCELDKTVPVELQSYSSDKVPIANVIAMAQQIYESRSSSGVKSPPVYFILIGWDKAIGFGIDRDYDIVSATASLLQLCGEYDMHFIFICSGTGQIGANIIDPCKVRICGKVNEDTSYKILETKQGCKVDENAKNGYIYIRRGGVVTRAKIYLSRGNREIQSSELIL